MSAWSGDARERFVLVNERLLDLYNQAIVKTMRSVRICFVALVASALVEWAAVPPLPAGLAGRVSTLSVVVAGFAAASLVVLSVLLAVWAAQKRRVVALLLEVRNVKDHDQAAR